MTRERGRGVGGGRAGTGDRRRTSRANGNFRSNKSVVFWYFRISRRAFVPGRQWWRAREGVGTGSPA